MKKMLVTPENPNGIYVDFTPEEITQRENEIIASDNKRQQIAEQKENLKNLKASAKTKLIAGEKLTEEEANVLVGV